MSDTVDAEAWVKSVDPLCTSVRDLGDGRYACVSRLMFHWTLKVGAVGDEWGYDDRWCYETEGRAIRAMMTWDIETENEPTGWHRHPRTGRRRPGGDASQEYRNA